MANIMVGMPSGKQAMELPPRGSPRALAAFSAATRASYWALNSGLNGGTGGGGGVSRGSSLPVS